MSNSIGDLKNSGLQGNNWPWQYKVLDGIQKIYDFLVGSSLVTARTPVIASATGTGSVPVSYGFSIANVGGAAGLVGGVTLPAGTTVNFAPDKNNTLNGITYDATGTTFLITRIQ
jgi:hypothetical protein